MTLTPILGLPMFERGQSVAREIAAAMARQGLAFEAGDVLVLAQKIVSKTEGRVRRLGEVTAGAEAEALSARTGGRPAALMQLMLDESAEILRATPVVVIARHRTGHVLANAGIDASNVQGGAEDTVLLWPEDPDASARAVRAELAALVGIAPAVVIADSLGRAWRMGTVGTAIGAAGLVVVDDRRGEVDLFGRTLQATLVGVADSLAAAAVVVMGEGAEGAPAAIVRGAARHVTADDGPGAAAAIRPLKEDLFR
jgi:coenzyme F420-0:L-glutamate ligase/coenzyme F420-1:gamma-L-glutamate ligase